MKVQKYHKSFKFLIYDAISINMIHKNRVCQIKNNLPNKFRLMQITVFEKVSDDLTEIQKLIIDQSDISTSIIDYRFILKRVIENLDNYEIRIDVNDLKNQR